MDRKIDWNQILTTKKFYELTFIIVTLGSFFIWLVLIFSQGAMSAQFNTFFGRCYDFLADTLNVVGYSSLLDVYDNTMYTGLAEKAYPPLTYAVMYLFSRLVDMTPYYDADCFLSLYAEPQFLIIFIICLCIALITLYEIIRYYKDGSQLIKILTAFSVLLSSPMLFTIERANTIIVTLFFIMFYIVNYDSKNKVLKELALVSLALAAALKMTPAVLGILLLYNKQWKEAVRAVLYGILIGFLPFLFFKGGFANIFKFIRNTQIHLATYSDDSGCTLLACLSQFWEIESDAMYMFIKICTWLISLSLFLFSVFYKHKWETIMAVTTVLIILPSHSGQYCILYTIPALIAFLNEEEHSNKDIIILIAFLLITQNVQWPLGYFLFNYRLSILIFVCYLLVKGAYMFFQALNHQQNLSAPPQ